MHSQRLAGLQVLITCPAASWAPGTAAASTAAFLHETQGRAYGTSVEFTVFLCTEDTIKCKMNH